MKVASWCVQYRPESRNAPTHPTQIDTTFYSEYSSQVSFECDTPVMRKYEIEIAST